MLAILFLARADWIIVGSYPTQVYLSAADSHDAVGQQIYREAHREGHSKEHHPEPDGREQKNLTVSGVHQNIS